MKLSTLLVLTVIFFTRSGFAQDQQYPQNYFRHPLSIPLQLVANFGEIRANHWHMGLDIRTQQKVNLPVYAAADGYISRVSVEPGSFGQAIYITHPNGYTTLYGHLNSFFPALAAYVKQQQYALRSWRVQLSIAPDLFPVKKGELIALSGSTGASEGPHVHFEIRDSQTENCLNPLLFRFPIADAVAPSINGLAVYDRNISTYEQSPRLVPISRKGSSYSAAPLRTGSDKISFAVRAVDHFSGSANPNGIYSAKAFLDDVPVSGFTLDNISYNDTRYINAQIDYPYRARGGAYYQHISPLPGATRAAYQFTGDGMIHLADENEHDVRIEVGDANGNASTLRFRIRLDRSLTPAYRAAKNERLLPNNVNVVERDNFEMYTTEKTLYDTVSLTFSETPDSRPEALTPIVSILSAAIPAHDTITIRMRPTQDGADVRNHAVIVNHAGSRTYVEKARWAAGWLTTRFRQFGSFQAFVDTEPPRFNTPPSDLSKASRIVITPKDNFENISEFRADLDGKWLRFSNDKGVSWIYNFDENFPRGEHVLTISVTDVAGNTTTKSINVRR